MCSGLLYHWSETAVLREAVERDVGRASHDFGKVGLGVSWRIGVSWRAELLKGHAGFIWRRGRGVADILTEDMESLPQSKGLERQDYLGARSLCHIADKRKITAKLGFFN